MVIFPLSIFFGGEPCYNNIVVIVQNLGNQLGYVIVVVILSIPMLAVQIVLEGS